MKLLSALVIFLLSVLLANCTKLTVDILSKKPLKRFWASTGFSPNKDPFNRHTVKTLLGRDTFLNLAFIGSLPHEAFKQVRIHWLLDLVIHENDRFNFTNLDKLLDHLWKYDLNPGFEMMGDSPHDWEELARQLAVRYIKRYGLKTVSEWNFESWNEPDHRKSSGINMTLNEYLSYFDSVSAGLQSASPHLRFGGPGGSCRYPNFFKMCYGLLSHVKGGRLDYLSFHVKGESLIEDQMKLIPTLTEKMGLNFSQIEIYNDEGDPLKGWWKLENWRGDVRFEYYFQGLLRFN